jgi:hypothetical protein
MDEFMVDEFGMNFHPIYLSHLGYGIHVYYFTKFPYVNGISKIQKKLGRLELLIS